MERTRQRYVPLVLFAAALALIAARVTSHFVGKKPPKGELVRWISAAELSTVAPTSNKPILFDFTADWCAPCHLLDEQVFRDPAIARVINERFLAVRVVDRLREEGKNTATVADLQRRYSPRGFPTVVFTDPAGNQLERMEGFSGREEFRRIMERVR